MYHDSLKIETLVGRKVLSALINEEKDIVILDTDKGKLFLSWTGDCCARCYLAHVEGVSGLIGGTILEAFNSEWDRKPDGEYGVTESMGTKIRTDRGYVEFESRVDHNGYYGGTLSISEVGPLSNYGRYIIFNDDMSELKDF